MRRALVLACFAPFALPEALAQAVTRPTITVSAGVLRAPDAYDQEGNTSGESEAFDAATTVSYSVGLGAEVPLLLRGGATVSAGARLTAASYGIQFEDDTFGGDLVPQNLMVYGRAGTSQASALLGVALDLGLNFYDQLGGSTRDVNSDGQHALVGQLRGEIPAGPARLHAQADASLTFADETQLLINSIEDPVGVPVDVAIDTGNPYGVQVGAAVPAGPVVLGLAVFYAARTEGRFEYLDGVPDGFPDGVPAVQPVNYGYREAFGVIPSVEYRAPGGRLRARLEGAFSEFYAMENVPVGLTLSGASGPVTRPAATLRVGVEL